MPVAGQLTVVQLAAGLGLQPAPGASPESLDRLVSGVSLDSSRVSPGYLYAALPGARTHGAGYAAAARDGGAVALLTDPDGLAMLAPEVRAAVPVLVSRSPRAALGPASALIYGHPSRRLAVLGVTGTNGKTTVTYLAHHLLRSLQVSAGLVGTVAVRVLDDERASSFTTPEAPDLQHLFAEMLTAGLTTVAVEVSSHALAQYRVDGTCFEVAVFTNLSRDHLDFHGTMADYLDAKLRLFSGDLARNAVVCVDDEAGRTVAQRARAAGLAVTTVAGRAGSSPADVTVGAVTAAADGTQRFEVRGPFASDGTTQTVDVDLPMPGRFNTVNAALAMCAVHRLLVRSGQTPDMATLAAHLATFEGVPGRMQRIVDPQAPGVTPLVVVDYAHTPDAVAAAVRALRPATRGRLVVVLGAGGDRDTGKRAPMGEAAAAAADVVVVTDDNPRGEDPATIRAAVLHGATSAATRRAGDIVEVADRAAAIARALAACGGPDDTVLVTGKGHETGQQYRSGAPVPFDDRTVAAAALHAWAVEAALAPDESERALTS